MILVLLSDIDELELALPIDLSEHVMIYLSLFLIDNSSYIESFVLLLILLTSYGITE